MNILFLDDSLHRCARFKPYFPTAEITRTARETIEVLPERHWDLVFLGEENASTDPPKTGMEVVRWVAENRPRVAEFIVHSLNHPAASEMVAKLREAGYLANAFPYISFNGRFF